MHQNNRNLPGKINSAYNVTITISFHALTLEAENKQGLMLILLNRHK